MLSSGENIFKSQLEKLNSFLNKSNGDRNENNENEKKLYLCNQS